MTRDDFVEYVTCWGDLIEFCDDFGCAYCEDVYDDEGKDDFFNEDLVEMARNANNWQDLKSELDDIPDGYDYYIRDNYDGSWSGADDYDFDRYKDDVLEWGDNNDVWEDDEEECEEETSQAYIEEEADDDDEPEPVEDVSLSELFISSVSTVQVIADEVERKKEQEEEMFNAFLRGEDYEAAAKVVAEKVTADMMTEIYGG